MEARRAELEKKVSIIRQNEEKAAADADAAAAQMPPAIQSTGGLGQLAV